MTRRRYHLSGGQWRRRGLNPVLPGQLPGGETPPAPLAPKLQVGLVRPTVQPFANISRFPGDPGMGKFYFGGREDQLTWSSSETAIATWEDRMAPWSGGRKLSIIRVFGSGDVTNGVDTSTRNLVTTHHTKGRLPHISFKLPAGVTLQQAATRTGSFDTWIQNLASWFKSKGDKPVWWTFWHEPENDNDTGNGNAQGQAWYRAACRNMVAVLREEHVTNAAFAAVGYMCPYTFGDRGGTRDWREWYPDWKGTTSAGSSKNAPNPVDFYVNGDGNSVVDIVGLDVYSWWDEGEAVTGTSAYESFSKLAGWAFDRMDFLGKPYAIMEHGVQAIHTGVWNADPGLSTAVFDDSRTLAYLSAMFDTMVSKNVIAMMVYNYALVQHHWRLEMADPNRARYRGYGTGMTRPEHVTPAQIGWL